jgi:predicted RNA polymerase sigma factor
LVPLPEEHDAQDGQALIATTPDPETATICRDQERTLERLVSALPDPYREALILREIEDLDYREIAAVTNVPLGTVMSRLSRTGCVKETVAATDRRRATCCALNRYASRLILMTRWTP